MMNMSSAIGGFVQGGVGTTQLAMALMMKKKKRPTYEAPQALKDAARMAESEANATADPMMSAAQDRVRQNTANTLQAQQKGTQSMASLLNAASQAQVVQNQGMNNLAAQGMGLREQRRNRRYSLANAMAAAQDRSWDYNQNQPYQQNAAAVRALFGAGMQNMAASGQTFAGAASGPAPDGVDYQAQVAREREEMSPYNSPGAYDSPNTYRYMS